MGFTWKCSAGTLQLPSAGLHAPICQGTQHRVEWEPKQPIHGLGEGHILVCSSHSVRKTARVTAGTRDCRFRSSSRNCGISASRRRIRKNLLKLPTELGNYLEPSNVHNSLFNSRCLNIGWSQRVPFTSTYAHDNNSSKGVSSPSPESPRYDSEEDTEYDERKRNSSFQDYGKHTDGEEPYGDHWKKMKDGMMPPNSASATDGNGEYQRLSRNDSNASDLFREGRDSVWADEGRAEDGEESPRGDSAKSANSAGSEYWGEESESSTDSGTGSVGSAADSLAIGGKEPVYQVLEVLPGGNVVQREVSRRQLLRSIAGLRLRDIRSVDPSLWVTNSVPAILVRDQAILLNLGSLRAIATSQSVLIFEQKSVGAEAFLEALLPRLRTASNGQGPIMPFELEVVEAALISRTQRLERMLMDVEPRVMALLKVLPIRYTGDVLEELRLGKQALVELAAKAGALRQMLLEMLEHPEDIRKMTIMGRTCSIRREDGTVECSIPLDKKGAADEEEEIEMLLEYYLQRCDSCHGQAEKLLDAAKEMEDSIGVNLSSRRLEVSRLELLLQVGTFCSALGALVAGIFGMNLKSYLEDRAMAFYITTAGIVFGGIALFIVMLKYLKARKIL
ncbi:hypothetical protein KC19_5G125300 [Ceratodon purpureus]|uniref:Magnesium transporter n=1 Tax=Ceratodon purpureus TaxID=3225 RepID=A0A8T0I1L0_CERPU|nr:hypothetical protein KC19_5G125300 [Ceratodon purpureus]